MYLLLIKGVFIISKEITVIICFLFKKLPPADRIYWREFKVTRDLNYFSLKSKPFKPFGFLSHSKSRNKQQNFFGSI